MREDIGDRLERARSQIECKFSEAGNFLQATLGLIERQLELLGNLNKVLGQDAVESATQQLLSTSRHLDSLPAALAGRDARLRDLKRNGQALRVQIKEVRGLLRYLRVFALNVKITAATIGSQTQQFESFSSEMGARIDHGEKQIDDFEADLQALERQIDAALQTEGVLASQACAMLPAVPASLSKDAVAIGCYHQRVSEMTSGVFALAKQIQMSVLNVLSALQIGDIARQRIEHVQTALATLAEVEARLCAAQAPEDARRRLDAYVCGMLAAQLTDTAEIFEAEATRVLAQMDSMASDTQRLLQMQQLESKQEQDGDLRSLEQSVAKALVLVTGMDKAAEGADLIQQSTSKAVHDLVARIGRLKDVKDDVQYMALNTTLRCVRIGDAGKPLQVVASELSLYAKMLEAAANGTLEALQTLAQTAAGSAGGSGTRSNARDELEASVARLRAAADVVEHDLGDATSQGRNLVSSLARAGEKLDFKEALVDVVYEAADALKERAGEVEADSCGIEEPLQEILDRVARTYTMARERAVHAEFTLPGTSPVVAEPEPAVDDDIEMFA